MLPTEMITEHQSIRTEFPYRAGKNCQVTIKLSDGIQLAATIWVPTKKDDHLIKKEQFCTILEYLPYRKADWTSNRDEKRLSYIASNGYVALRVDIRGTGNSQGYFDDEYSEQELSDGLEIIQWITQQCWSNGKVVLFGKSWGGFNGLQLASLGNEHITGVISAYSTDDRYSDDIHYIGGCLAAQEALPWSTQMLLWLSIPPHESYQGGLDSDEDLMTVWRDRLEHLQPLDIYWIKHQTRDNYWRHGSVCENYLNIRCPVLLIGGFADLYSDPVFRLLDKLSCPKRAILGPWGHQWPDEAFPGPQIGFLQEVIQWLDFYQKGILNGYDKKETISVYQLFPNVDELHSRISHRQGRWIHTNEIPQTPAEHYRRNQINNDRSFNELFENGMKFFIQGKSLIIEQEPLDSRQISSISFCSPEETGLASGNILGWGSYQSPDHPPNQLNDDQRCLIIQSSPLKESIDIFGFPIIRLQLSSDQPVGLICARLCLFDEDNMTSILLSRGIFNLTHMNSHEQPAYLTVDENYSFEMKLSGLCAHLPKGKILRLCFSTSYWPTVWPSSAKSKLTIHFHDILNSFLILPILKTNYSVRDDFGKSEVSSGIPIKQNRNSSNGRLRIIDEVNECIQLKIDDDDGDIEYPDGLRFDEKSSKIFQIVSNDHQSARIDIRRTLKYYRLPSSKFNVEIELISAMFNQSNDFIVQHQLNITNHDQLVFHRFWDLKFPRLFN